MPGADATTTFADLARAQGSVLFTVRDARRRWDNLVAVLPSESVTVIAPRCLDALAALEHVQRGFYLTERLEGGGLRCRRRSLVVAHTGELHRRLPDLAFLHLLQALATPDILKF